MYVAKTNTWLRDIAFYILIVYRCRALCAMVTELMLFMCNGIIDATITINTADCTVTNKAEKNEKKRQYHFGINVLRASFLEQQKKEWIYFFVQSTTSTHWHIRSSNGHGYLLRFLSSFSFSYFSCVRSHSENTKILTLKIIYAYISILSFYQKKMWVVFYWVYCIQISHIAQTCMHI